MQRRCELRRERNQYAVQRLCVCMCVRAHTCKAVVVSAIRLVAVLYQGLILKVVQMTLNSRVDVLAPVGCLYNIKNSFLKFAQDKSPEGGTFPVPPDCPV